MVSYITTPSSPRHVSFMPIPVYSRPCQDDELFVMRAFEKHAKHCPHCVDPLSIHLKGATICPRGHSYAADVAQYVYNKEGRAYSLVDRKAHQRVRLELPADCVSLKSLLRAWEKGMKLLQVKRERRQSDDTESQLPSSATKRQPVRKVTIHRRNTSQDSSDLDLEGRLPSGYSNEYYYQPESYVPSHRQPVYYRVITPSSPTHPTYFYPR